MLSKSFYPDLKRQSVAELMGKPAPDFTLNDPSGQKTTLSTLISGKVALISFTACRCGACRLEAPVLTQLDKKYKDQGLVVLAINAWDEPAELVRKYVESEKLTHRFLLNGHDVWRDRYHFFETPTTCWIDHKGRVINVHFGFDPGDEVALARRAEELLCGAESGCSLTGRKYSSKCFPRTSLRVTVRRQKKRPVDHSSQRAS